MARAFSEDVTVFVSDLNPFAAQALVEQARALKGEVETEQQGRRGVQPLTRTFVDGQENPGLTEVKPESIILLNWDYRAEIVKAAFEELRARAPVASGNYRDSFVVLLDGVGLGPLQIPDPAQLKDIAVVTITNLVPYARRLEVAVTKSGRAFVRQVEPHIVESAMRAIKSEFSAVAKVDFGYIDLEHAYVAKTNLSNRRRIGSGWRTTHRRDRGKGVAIRYPAITIERF